MRAAARALLWLGCASLWLIAVFLALVFWDAIRAARLWKHTPPGAHFVRRGDRYESARPEMVEESFPVEKGGRTLRVFVMGSSQAMGAPYVQQRANSLSGRLMGMPNTGGISTWLQRYLQRLFPDKEVQVINTAKAGCELAASVPLFKEIVEIGQPDLIVILEGNNERNSTQLDGYALKPGAAFAPVLEALTANFERRTSEVVALAESKDVNALFMTVPNNIRDWLPLGEAREPDPGGFLAEFTRADPRELLGRVGPAPEDPIHMFLAAKCLDRMGEFERARRLYLAAKDGDRAFLRTRSRWNDIIRGIRSPRVRVLDMERILARYARDGIPGSDLFHDYCHMTLEANRIVAFELAQYAAAGLGPSRMIALDDVPLRTPWQVRWLYRIKALKWYKALKWMKVRCVVEADILDLNSRIAAEEYLRRGRDSSPPERDGAGSPRR